MSLTTRAPRTPSQIGDSKTWSSSLAWWFKILVLSQSNWDGTRGTRSGSGTTSNRGTPPRMGTCPALKRRRRNDFKRKLRRDGTRLRRAGRDTNAARELSGLEIVDVYLGRFDQLPSAVRIAGSNSIQRICSFGALRLDLQLRSTTPTAPRNFALKQVAKPGPGLRSKIGEAARSSVIVAADGKNLLWGREAIWATQRALKAPRYFHQGLGRVPFFHQEGDPQNW